MEKTLISSLKGTRDLYPEDMAQRRGLLESVRKTVQAFGYQEYDAPLLEPLALYTAKSSPEIIERQAYVFTDRGGERLVVRPEMTPSLARMIATRQRELPSIIRWFSFPECWRYERPQKGRLRNFLQINVDLIGSDTVQADVEVLDLALSLLRDLGVDLSVIELRLNDRRLLEGWLSDAGVAREQWMQVLSLLDERDKIEAIEFRQRLSVFVAADKLDQLIRRFELSAEDLLADPWAERLCQVRQEMIALGWQDCIKLDPSVIRGFAYYTGIVFEVNAKSAEFRRAIFGGGRYNRLVEDMGGTSVPGIGFGVSDVSLYELFKLQKLTVKTSSVNKVMVIPFSAAEEIVGRQVIGRLRQQAGVQVIQALPAYKLKDQLKLAKKLNVRRALLLFPEELKRQQIICRDMLTGEQENLALENIAKRIAFDADAIS